MILVNALRYLVILSTSWILQCQCRTQSEGPITLPSPFSFPASDWHGIDGEWSSFALRVGTPSQLLRVLPSTAGYQTWVVHTAGCPSLTESETCPDSRGGLFHYNTSTTWEPNGIYKLWIERNLEYGGNAEYGFDTVGLAANGEGGPTLEKQIVAALATEDHFLGIFGLNPMPTNFTGYNNPTTSYMTHLFQENLIPSVSFGYTAGAPYRLRTVPGSLTLGGIDRSKFVANNLSFTLGPNNERDILVGLQAITTTSNDTSESVALLPNPIYSNIDSTVSQIWLPENACRAFEQEFGLIYDNATELYLVDELLHRTLITRNASISFILGTGLSGGETVEIVLPYASFDLTAKPPYRGLQASSRYFPLRRAANETQYTLGRTFLQEAYLTVDWGARTFSVSQATFQDHVESDIEAIVPFNPPDNPPLNEDPQDEAPTDNPVSVDIGKIVGAVVGCVTAGCVVVTVWALLRRRRQRAKGAESAKAKIEELITEKAKDSDSVDQQSRVFPKAELDATERGQWNDYRKGIGSRNCDEGSMLKHDMLMPVTPSTSGLRGNRDGLDPVSPMTPASDEASGTSIRSSNPAANEGTQQQIFEMPGDMPERQEADGRAMSEKEVMIARERRYNGFDPFETPPATPATAPTELGRTSSAQAKPVEMQLEQNRFSFEPNDDRQYRL